MLGIHENHLIIWRRIVLRNLRLASRCAPVKAISRPPRLRGRCFGREESDTIDRLRKGESAAGAGLARHAFRIGAQNGERIIDAGDKKRLLNNFASLSVLQGADYILPFVTVPYLTRVLGPSHYGLIGFAAALINYFTILTGYGFNLSATREISLRRDDRERISRIFSSIMIIKAGLLALSLILLLAVVYSFDRFREDAAVYLISFGLAVGSALFPVWLFQGMERMKYMTYINLAGRSALAAAVFMLVSGENGPVMFVILNSATAVLVGIASLICAVKVFNIRFVLPTLDEIRKELVEGWYVFISSISIVLYTSSTTFILGLFTNNTVVGYYTGADKIRQAVQGIFGPVFQTLFPYVSKLAHDSKEKALEFMRKEVLYFGFVGLFICALVFVNAEFLVGVILGKEFSASVDLLRILAFVPVLVILGNILTIQCLLSLGLRRDYSIIYLFSSVVGVMTMILLTYRYGARGVSASVVFIETLVIAMTLYRMRRKGISLFGASGARP